MEITLDELRKVFPNAEYSEGSGKFGTTKARVLRGDNWHAIESPRYPEGIKVWTHIGETKQFNGNTVAELCNLLTRATTI